MGPDNIHAYLLKLALPYVVESLTYIYNLRIKKKKYFLRYSKQPM